MAEERGFTILCMEKKVSLNYILSVLNANCLCLIAKVKSDKWIDRNLIPKPNPSNRYKFLDFGVKQLFRP